MGGRITYIYGLYDPRDGVIRYVGKTMAYRSRLRQHISAARKGKTYHVYCWIRKLLREQIRPEIRLIETVVPGGDWVAAERRLIAQYRKSSDLTNIGDGGECPPLGLGARIRWQRQRSSGQKWIMPSEAAARVWAANRGRKHGPEMRRRCSEFQRKRWLQTEVVEAHRARMLAQWRDPAFKQTILSAMAEPAVRARMAESHRGKRLSEQARRKTVEAVRARWADPEYQKRLGAKMKARWANPAQRAALLAARQRSSQVCRG